MNKKLVIGLVVSVFFLIILIRNCSSVENSLFHSDNFEKSPNQDGMNVLGDNNILLIDKNTGRLSQSTRSAKITFDDIKSNIGNTSAAYATNASINVYDAIDGPRIKLKRKSEGSAGEELGPIARLHNYKNLLGPGLFTVLGVPENGGLRAGSHGILGDMYRYREKVGGEESESARSWNAVGGWSDSSPTKYDIWKRRAADLDYGVGTHISRVNGALLDDKPWERIKLLNHEIIPTNHGDPNDEWHISENSNHNHNTESGNAVPLPASQRETPSGLDQIANSDAPSQLRAAAAAAAAVASLGSSFASLGAVFGRNAGGTPGGYNIIAPGDGRSSNEW